MDTHRNIDGRQQNCERLTCSRCRPVQMALKCADICNPCRPWELSKRWSEKVTEEFFQQGLSAVLLFVITLKLFISPLKLIQVHLLPLFILCYKVCL